MSTLKHCKKFGKPEKKKVPYGNPAPYALKLLTFLVHSHKKKHIIQRHLVFSNFS